MQLTCRATLRPFGCTCRYAVGLCRTCAAAKFWNGRLNCTSSDSTCLCTGASLASLAAACCLAATLTTDDWHYTTTCVHRALQSAFAAWSRSLSCLRRLLPVTSHQAHPTASYPRATFTARMLDAKSNTRPPPHYRAQQATLPQLCKSPNIIKNDTSFTATSGRSAACPGPRTLTEGVTPSTAQLVGRGPPLCCHQPRVEHYRKPSKMLVSHTVTAVSLRSASHSVTSSPAKHTSRLYTTITPHSPLRQAGLLRAPWPAPSRHQPPQAAAARSQTRAGTRQQTRLQGRPPPASAS
jgi:hypothetical protein